MKSQQMRAPAIPINKAHYDHNIDFSCDTADHQQHEEELFDLQMVSHLPVFTWKTRNILLCMVGDSGSHASNAI
jgi:hypothetical protein